MRRAPLLLGAAVTVVLVVFAGGYGYHRDELYFLEAGHHLAWSYADQGPVTPLVARLMSDIAPGSLTVLRIPSPIAGWLVVRAVRTGDNRLWPVAGVVLGLGLLNKPLPAFLAVGLLAGVLIAGPR